MKKTGTKWRTYKCGRCGKTHQGYSGKLDADGIEYVVCGVTNSRMDVVRATDPRGVVFPTQWIRESRGHTNVLMSATKMYPAAYNTLGVEVQLPSFPIREGSVELKGVKARCGVEVDHEMGVVSFFTLGVVTPDCEILYYPVMPMEVADGDASD